jgi:hypothetical protein
LNTPTGTSVPELRKQFGERGIDLVATASPDAFAARCQTPETNREATPRPGNTSKIAVPATGIPGGESPRKVHLNNPDPIRLLWWRSRVQDRQSLPRQASERERSMQRFGAVSISRRSFVATEVPFDSGAIHVRGRAEWDTGCWHGMCPRRDGRYSVDVLAGGGRPR